MPLPDLSVVVVLGLDGKVGHLHGVVLSGHVYGDVVREGVVRWGPLRVPVCCDVPVDGFCAVVVFALELEAVDMTVPGVAVDLRETEVWVEEERDQGQ